MSSKEKVLAIRPRALCKASSRQHYALSPLFEIWIGNKKVVEKQSTARQAWASAYKYLTK